MPDFTTYGFVSGYHDLYWIDRDVDGTLPTLVAATHHLGSTGDEGIRQVTTKSVEDITGDALGDTVVDAIYKGGNVELEFVLQELNKTAVHNFISCFRETASLAGNVRYDNEVGIVGHTAANPNAASGVGFAGSLVAIPRAGTPADLSLDESTTGRWYMGYPYGDFSEFLDTRLNVMPVRFKALPFVNSSSITVWWDWLTTAAP